MSQRIAYAKEAPELTKGLFNFSRGLAETGLDRSLLDLVNIRASLLNGCAFCLDMHVKEAKIHGERELRVYHVPIWRESTLFSDRERVALEWTEAVTRLAEGGVSDELYGRARGAFSEKELTELTFAVASINAWNRLAITFRSAPGSGDAMYGLTKAGLS